MLNSLNRQIAFCVMCFPWTEDRFASVKLWGGLGRAHLDLLLYICFRICVFDVTDDDWERSVSAVGKDFGEAIKI